MRQIKKPFLDFLKEKKTFGADVMLALLSDQTGPELVALLKANAGKISKLSDDQKMELGVFVIPKLTTDVADVRELFEVVLANENEVQLQKFKESLEPREEDNAGFGEAGPGEVFLRFYQQDPELALRALRIVQSSQEAGNSMVALFAHQGNWFHESLISDLLEKLTYGVDRSQHGRSATEFYFRVLADEKLGPHLIVNERLLNPEFSEAKTDSQRLERLKDALVWIAEIYPEDLAKEYFFIATIEQSGHLSASAQRAANNAGYREEVVAAVPPEFRDLATAALELTSVSDGWVYKNTVTPKWNEPKVAAAFEAVSKLLRNENLPLNLRLAVAASVCDHCGIQTEPKVALQCADLLATAWRQLQTTTIESEYRAHMPVSESQANEILRVLSFQKMDESYRGVAGRLTEAWKLRVAQREREIGKEVRSSDEAIWVAGLLAVLNDDTSFAEAMDKQYQARSERVALRLLPLLLRAGKTAEAAELFKLATVQVSGKARSDQRTYYDEAIQQHLPAFLAEIEDPETRILAEAHLSGLGNWPFTGASDLPTRKAPLAEGRRTSS